MAPSLVAAGEVDMPYNAPRSIVASAARTTSDNSGVIGLFDRGEVVSLLIDVTAASGTGPTLDLEVEWSQDGGTTFAKADPPDSFAQITAVKKVTEQFQAKGDMYRVVWTIGGTGPSFTFSIREFVTDEEG